MKRPDEHHSFSVRIAEIVGPEKAILLNDFYGWCDMNEKNNRNMHNGKAWTFNSAQALAEKYSYMKRRSISRWLDELEKDEWIESANFNKKTFDQTKWYAVNMAKYNAVITSIGQDGQSNGHSEPAKTPIGQNVSSIGQNGQPYHLIHPSPTNNYYSQMGENDNNSFTGNAEDPGIKLDASDTPDPEYLVIQVELIKLDEQPDISVTQGIQNERENVAALSDEQPSTDSLQLQGQNTPEFIPGTEATHTAEQPDEELHRTEQSSFPFKAEKEPLFSAAEAEAFKKAWDESQREWVELSSSQDSSGIPPVAAAPPAPVNAWLEAAKKGVMVSTADGRKVYYPETREELLEIYTRAFEPANPFGYISSEAQDKVRLYYQEDEVLLAEARLGGRQDLPLEILRDLLRRFLTHPNFPSYAKSARVFADLRQQFLKWIKGEKLNLNLAYFSGQDLLEALKKKKPDTAMDLDGAAKAANDYKTWVREKQLALEAMTVDEMAGCLITAGFWKKFIGCCNFMAARRDYMKQFRRQYEAWRAAWKDYQSSIV